MRRCWVASAIVLAGLVTFRPRAIADPGAWSGVDALMVAAWVTATLACARLGAAATLTAIATRTRRVRVARIAIRVAPSAVRPAVEAALAGALVLASVAPAYAQPVAPVVHADEPVVRAEPSVPVPRPSPAPAPPAAAARTHVVRPGDNLWSIAREELQSRNGARADDAAVARYWLAVIAANRGTLRSGNPNLIFPGELVALPGPV